LVDAPVPRRRANSLAETEEIAFDLCVFLFNRGKTDGRYAIEAERLSEAMGIDPPDLQRALQLAEERAWLEYAGLLLALRAAGIYVAKTALDLPR
jgi:hypothetical protein